MKHDKERNSIGANLIYKLPKNDYVKIEEGSTGEESIEAIRKIQRLCLSHLKGLEELFKLK